MLTIFNKKLSQGFKLSNLNVGLVVMLTLIGMLSPLIVNTRKAYADDSLRASTQEQQNRTKARALVRCLETSDIYIPDDHVAKARLPNRDVSVGHEIASDDGNMNCDQFFDEFKGMVGIKDNVDLANRIMKDGNSIYAIVDNNKREQLENEWISKLEEYANQRSPMIKSEELRRLRTAIGVCADATNETVPNNNKDAYFEIDGDRFKYKEGPSKWVALGHDYWDEDGDGGERCGAIVERAMAVKAFSQEADDIIAYEAQCITEGAADINACIAQKVATQGHGDPGGGDSGGGGGEKTKVDCDAISFNALKWFLCPVINMAEKAVDALDKLITYMLTFPTKAYFEDNDGLQQAWSRFRNLSIGLLLIAGLVMVISQAIGTGPFDAYTIKRVMPRMLFAVVFISISWSVLRIMIEFTNIAGVGVRNLIETSFGSESFGNITFNNGSMLIGNLTMAAMGLSLGFLGMLSLLGTALLGVLIAFVVLAMRQMVIVMLIVLAPVAIACYILPNTEKIWKMWWDFFIRAIFAFPIISMFIAVGHAFAAISANSTGLDSGSDIVLKDTIASLIAFAAYFGPYFALPYAFKLAGGAVAQIGGVVNDRSRGAFDRMKNYRGRKMKENFQGMQQGSRFNGNNFLSRRANRSLQTATLVPQAGLSPRKWRSRTQAARSEVDFNSTMKSMEESAAVRAVSPNDTLLNAGLHGRGTEANVRRYLENQGQTGRELDQNVAAVMRAKAELGGHEGFSRMAAVALAGTGTGYGAGPGEMAETIARVSGNDHQLAGQLLNAARQKAQGANRVDLHGSSFGTNLGAVNGIINGTQTPDQVNETLTDAVLDSQSAGAIISGRNGGTVNMVPAIQRRIQRAEAAVHAAYNGGSTQDQQTADRNFQQVLASTAGMLDAAGQVSPQNARTIADEVMSMNVQDHANRVQGTLAEHIEANRDNDEFREMRREYATSAAQQAQMLQQQQTQIPPGGAPPQVSDIRLKRNITYYKTCRDIKLYKFQYIWSNQVYIGVIAQDLLSTHPHAVHINKNGYYSVDYTALGLRMVKVEPPRTKTKATN